MAGNPSTEKKIVEDIPKAQFPEEKEYAKPRRSPRKQEKN